jgi:hypothetical protein
VTLDANKSCARTASSGWRGEASSPRRPTEARWRVRS